MPDSSSSTPQNYTIGMQTDVGGRRSHNEDTAAIIDVPGTQAAFVLCDGMGGLRAGDVASRQAVRSIAILLRKRFAEGPPADPLSELNAAFVRANDAVNKLHFGGETDIAALSAEDDAPTERPTQGAGTDALMGTTCVAGIVRDDTLYLAHAGDSRAYLYRDGALTRLTEDHSYVAERVRAGDITEAEAKISRFRNMITRAIGIEPEVHPELRHERLRQGDSILVCSDGLTNEINDTQIAEILRSNPPERVAPDRVAQQLTDAANRAGGSDNITVVLLRAGGVGDAPAKVAAATKLPTAPVPVVVPTPKASAKPAPKPVPVEKPAPAAPMPTPANGGGIVDIDAPLTPWKPKKAGFLQAGSVLFGVALALGAAIAIFALVPDARRETARVLRGQTPVEATQETRTLARASRDFSKLVYDAPVRFSDVLARGDFLAYSHAAGLYCAGADSGAVMALAIDTGKPGHTGLATLPAAPTSSPDAAGAALARTFVAADASGDLYVSSPRTKTVEKRGPDGKLLLTLRGFARPEALALDEDGNLYVVDFNLVKILRAKEATAVASPAPASPAAAPASASPAAHVPPAAAAGKK